MNRKLKKILVVEDDRASAKILATLFGKWGFDVITAGDGAKGWELFQSDPDIRIVISDWMMPEIDGVELCRKVRSLVDRHYTYFILLTAKTQTDDVVIGMEAGADDFVTKPFNQYELRVRIHAGERVVDLETELAGKVEELSTAYRQMRNDLAAAAAMQQGMIPPLTGRLPGLRYSACYIPSEGIGGDMFNVIELPDSRLGVYIFDVSGHGVAAALQSVAMGRMLSPYNQTASLLLDSFTSDGSPAVVPPRAVVDRLNSRFQSASSKGDFITFLYGILSKDLSTFTYTRAGHPAPVLVSAGSLIDVPDKGDIPIGILPNYSYEENVLKLKPSDRLYFFTDGVLEASNPSRVRFGEEKLHASLAETAALSLEESVERLASAVFEWCGKPATDDDMTVLGIEIHP